MANARNQSASPPPSSSPTIPDTTPGATIKPSDMTDKKLDATAAAVKKVSTVSESYKKKLAQAPNAEKDKIRDDADSDVTKAVTDQGLSVEEYLGIMKVARNDDDRAQQADRPAEIGDTLPGLKSVRGGLR